MYFVQDKKYYFYARGNTPLKKVKISKNSKTQKSWFSTYPFFSEETDLRRRSPFWCVRARENYIIILLIHITREKQDKIRNIQKSLLCNVQKYGFFRKIVNIKSELVCNTHAHISRTFNTQIN